jgi:rhodanese-related sulfurtransferase
MRPFIILGSLMLMLFALGACAAQPSTSPPVSEPAVAAVPFTTISVQDLRQRLDSDAPPFLLDVRTPEEYVQDGHAPEAVLIPLQELAQRTDELPRDQPIACICRSGNRSLTACDLLAAEGFEGLLNIDGGMRAWAQAGYPIE